jgi:predicted esterase
MNKNSFKTSFRMKYLITSIYLFSIFFNISAQQKPAGYFDARYGKLEYGVFTPKNYDSHQLYPVVVYLHGFGNNQYVYLDWYRNDIQAKNPCFVFSPKTPPEWADWSGWNDEKLSAPMISAIHVLDSLTSVFPIDTNRIYVYGISMGGEGVFDLLHKLPGKFAAAMSVCGGGQAWWAENVSKTPLWMFHGSADEINPPDLTERVYNRLVEIGAQKMRYISYPGAGHDIWDDAASEPAWFDWMFSFSKIDTFYKKPTKQIELTANLKNSELFWNDIRDENNKADKIWYYQVYSGNSVIAAVEFDKTKIHIDTQKWKGPFRVVAVNYNFQKSEPSNTVFLQ